MNKTINLIISWIEQWEMFLPPRSQEEGDGVFQDRHWDLSCLHGCDHVRVISLSILRSLQKSLDMIFHN